ncbi:aminopeptidase P family N-terminal domain-containing protein [Sinorhizobium psoraleae]|uniref:Aminopeptidase P family N-terminal domain-containing protein n=1 Tax=Sinorhizobium psoraleae TaxID=520838 RepID=A0ABT4KP97_9HYPH|nr:aminopeptidase P family N-terminal domain-containing protein [Sinorhizobium psoraleae]MCZ4093801.1 aminopeptidase P family N-terminal domain-containing protein [Sinorhizobium psoraleae]
MDGNPFTDGEIARRLGAVRAGLVDRGLDAAVFASPENVFYLTGLDHWGYFAPHLLIVPLQGEPTLVTRAMERVTIENHVRAAEFHGHSDSETAADLASRILNDQGFAGKRLGLEHWTSGLSHGLARRLESLVRAEWSDVSNLVDHLRLVKSAEEQVLLRRAAAITDAAAAAAIEMIADGARERDVAAECIAAMTRAGGHVPGFGPFIRPASRLGEEHTTWGSGNYRQGNRSSSSFPDASRAITRPWDA